MTSKHPFTARLNHKRTAARTKAKVKDQVNTDQPPSPTTHLLLHHCHLFPHRIHLLLQRRQRRRAPLRRRLRRRRLGPRRRARRLRGFQLLLEAADLVDVASGVGGEGGVGGGELGVEGLELLLRLEVVGVVGFCVVRVFVCCVSGDVLALV